MTRGSATKILNCDEHLTEHMSQQTQTTDPAKDATMGHDNKTHDIVVARATKLSFVMRSWCAPLDEEIHADACTYTT